MDRRSAGLVLLILVVLAAMAVPHPHGRRVPGVPTAMVVPGPPSVGDCVGWLSPQPALDPETSADQSVSFASAIYTSCTGLVVGEVMSVDRVPRLSETTVASYQDATSACGLREVSYVGSIGPFDPDKMTSASIAWYSAAAVDALVIGPDPLQKAVGQRWTACVGATAARTPYRGQIAKALTVGALPAVYALCWKGLPLSTSVQPDDQMTDCAVAHPVEVLGTTQIIEPNTSVQQVQRSCYGFAARAMRTSDPTRGGVLRVKAYSMDGESILPLSAVDLTAGYLGCLVSVAAPVRLTGTVIGLGDRPAPVTG